MCMTVFTEHSALDAPKLVQDGRNAPGHIEQLHVMLHYSPLTSLCVGLVSNALSITALDDHIRTCCLLVGESLVTAMPLPAAEDMHVNS